MAGLLGDGFEDPRSAAVMALAGGLLQGNMGGGLLGANAAYGNSQNDAMKRQYLMAQMQEVESQRQMQAAKAQQMQAEMARQQRIQQAAPGMFAPQGGGQPMGSGSTPGAFDVRRALELGMDPKMIQEYASLQNLGRPKATRQVEVDDGRGGKRIALVDDFGQEVAGFNGYTAPVQVNQGDRVSFVKPAPGVSLGVNMTPDARASNALGWANNALARRGQDLTDARSREANMAGRVPAGYRLSADGRGLEFIPGGPADPNAEKKAAPTEFQGKAAMFGTRAQEADRIISELEGKYSPSGINTKQALGGAPLIGGALEAGANLALSNTSQKAEQAQRDFVNAVLRLESGAAISQGEFENARKQYFPQPGDSKAVIDQKAANRKLAIQGLINNARPGAVETGGATGSFAASPDIDALLKKYGGK